MVTVDLFSDCLLLADEFFQYYLGINSRSTVVSPTGFTGKGRVLGTAATFGGPAVADNPLNEPGTFGLTSDVLPVEDFPLYASASAGAYVGAAGGAFDPVEGAWYAGAVDIDDSYARLGRAVDLTGVTAAETPQLRTKISYDVEPGYDHVIVEAHPVGSEVWTTLPEAGGLTTTTVPTECEAGFLLQEHPFLSQYLTLGDPCTASGKTGGLERDDGHLGRLADRHLRPVRLRGPAGRGDHQLRHRSVHRRHRGGGGRHGRPGRRASGGERRLRVRARGLAGGRPTGRAVPGTARRSSAPRVCSPEPCRRGTPSRSASVWSRSDRPRSGRRCWARLCAHSSVAPEVGAGS